ncbi:MAG: serine/threonine protein kinase [Nitrospinae bacterium]|nr:serine/threonine protein kinase [Nitrospinota bacterium]
MKAEIKKLGRYEIMDELGRGGMGIVLKGRDPQIDRMLALKIVKIEEADSMGAKELLERFYIEAKAAGKLNHTNIVTIYDVGEDEGKKFIAMEFIEGKDLSALISTEGAIPLPRAARIISQIADGLAYAHERGIVHRDIKPGNILLTGNDHVKITDFGLARLQSAGSVTQTGHAVGSPSYMSPEQVQGHMVDGRSDMFSLGVLFYEAVTGKRPFEGESLTTVIFKIIKDKPAQPSAVNKSLPESVDKIIGKMMAKNPDDRYPTCRDVARDLQQYINQTQSVFPLTSSDTMQTVDFNKGEILVEIESGSSSAHKHIPEKKFPVKAAALFGGVALLMAAAVIFVGGGQKERAVTEKVEAPAVAPKTAEAPPAPAADLKAPPAEPENVEKKEKTPAKPALPEKKAEVKTASAPVKAAPLKTGSVNVTSIPWSNIYLNGKDMGTTPKTLKSVPEGKAEIKLVNPGYRRHSGYVMVRRDETVEFSHTFTDAEEVAGGGERNSKEAAEEAGVGTLKVHSTPAGMVFIDGKLYGETPVTVNDIPSGQHNMVLKRPGMQDYKRKINVTPGITTSIAVE